MTTRRRSKFPLGLLALRTALAWAVALLLAAPAAYAMAFFKGKYTKDILM